MTLFCPAGIGSPVKVPTYSIRFTTGGVARQAIEWTSGQLTPANLQWLAALPQGPVPVDVHTEICHGAPWDEDAYLFDERDVERERSSLVRPLCLFGHTHVPSIFRVEPAVEAMKANPLLPANAPALPTLRA